MSLNIWDAKNFKGLSLPSRVRYFFNCVKWSKQRISRGYADYDIWNMYYHIQELMPEMLETLKNDRVGSPIIIYEDGNKTIIGEDTHKLYDEFLDKIIFHWRESVEDTCQVKNEYEQDYINACEQIEQNKGVFEDTIDENGKRALKMNFVGDDPRYEELYKLYSSRDDELEKYREDNMKKAMDLMRDNFFSFWD